MLSLHSRPHHRDHQHVQVTALDIETGLLLGHVTMEGPDPLTPDFEGLIRGELEGVLGGQTRRQGTMIEERR